MEVVKSELKRVFGPILEWFNGLSKYHKILVVAGVTIVPTVARLAAYKLNSKLRNYPPSWYGLPFLGCALFVAPLNKEFQISVAQFAKESGVMMVYNFGRPTVIVTDFDLYKQTFKSLTTRPATFKSSVHPQMFSMLSGKKWQKRRQINQECLVQLVNSKYIDDIMENLMGKVLYPIWDAAAAGTGSQHMVRKDIHWLGFAFFFGILFGVEADVPLPNDKNFTSFMALNEKKFTAIQTQAIIYSIPQPYRSLVDSYLNNNKYVDQMTDIIIEWQAKYVRNKSASDTYFGRLQKYVNEGEITLMEACADVDSLVGAGLHATMGSLEIAIYHLAKNQVIQDKVFAELDAHYEKFGSFPVREMNGLQLFRAFIYESLRCGNVVTSTLPRLNLKKDFQIGGYNIPYGAMILGSTYTVHQNPKYWDKPYDFYPEHFLAENGKFKLHPYFTLFGQGRRDCIGRPLAIKEMLCILAPLFYRYRFSIPSGFDPNEFVVVPGSFIVGNARQLPVCIEKRK